MRKRKPTSSVAKTAKGGNFTYFHNELNFSNARSLAYPACIYVPKKNPTSGATPRISCVCQSKKCALQFLCCIFKKPQHTHLLQNALLCLSASRAQRVCCWFWRKLLATPCGWHRGHLERHVNSRSDAAVGLAHPIQVPDELPFAFSQCTCSTRTTVQDPVSATL